jgi:hypothetical protein
MNAQKIGYWICTALIVLAFLSGGVVDLMRSPQALEGMRHLGYPAYFMLILGTWKVLGAITISVPRLALVKEWAYAGIIFDLTGASASHFASGDDAFHILVPLVLVAIAVASWKLRPASRKLSGV